MRKIVLLTVVILSSIGLSAQKSNRLLQPDFWNKNTQPSDVQKAIQEGNSPSERNERAFDATSLAILSDAPLEVIQYLIEQPGNGPDKLTHGQRTYLHWAASKENIPLVKYLISKGADIHALTDVEATPLYFAAISGAVDAELYEVFFDAGVSPKQLYDDGSTILMQAIASDKNLTLLEFLQTKGLSYNDTDKQGATVFDYATRRGDVALLKKLIERGAKATDNALLLAANGARRHTNSVEVYQYLIDSIGLNPQVQDKSGNTLLHIVLTKPGQFQVVQYLLEKGCNPNQLNNRNQNALILASSGSDANLFDLVLSRTANVHQIDTYGQTALTRAVGNGLPESVQKLLDLGLDINVLDSSGYNLAYHLVNSYRPPRRPMAPSSGTSSSNRVDADPFSEKMKLLQKHGLDVASPQRDGSTLYHVAVSKESIDLIEKLSNLNLNIDINAISDEGLTPLHRAALIAHDDKILKLLLHLGADKYVLSDMDETAYDIAQENGYLKENKIDISFLK